MKLKSGGRILLGLFGLLLIIAVWLAAWAFWFEPDSLTVKNYDVKIAGQNAAFKNLKIVAISDIHGGSNFITPEKIRKVVELANRQEPDLTVLLGDFVSQKGGDDGALKMPMTTIAENLRGLRAKIGVFAIIGNHDVWFDETATVNDLQAVGIRVLNEEAIKIKRSDSGQEFVLLGLPEFIKYDSQVKYALDAKAALAKVENGGNLDVIALVHNPDAFRSVTRDKIIDENLRLVLAGHTHGGQCDLPYFGALVVPSSYGQTYAKGLIEEYGRQLFVTPGIGTSVFPVRFRVPPEISVLTVNGDEGD